MGGPASSACVVGMEVRKRREVMKRRKRKGVLGSWSEENVLPALAADAMRAGGGCGLAGSAWKRLIGDGRST